MPTLLHIDASPLSEASISRHLSAEFVRKWQQANPDGKVTTRDLTTSGIPPVDSNWMGAVFTPEESRTAAHKETVALSDTLIAELEAADEYVFGVPMHNFSIPSTLKLWIDQIVRLGRTFSYGESGPAGLLKDKKATFLIASGGVYEKGTPAASLDFVEPYLRVIFDFIGVSKADFIVAGGAAAVMYGKVDRASFLKPFDEVIEEHFKQTQPAASIKSLSKQ
jgi:FMN-dependent NADH-azoreductase